MLLRVVDDGNFRDIAIKEGEMFLLPGTHARFQRPCTLTLHCLVSAERTFRVSNSILRVIRSWGTCTGNTPHNPVRFADTVGIVIERVRPAAAIGMYNNARFIFGQWGHALLIVRPQIVRPHLSNKDRLRWYCHAPAHETPTIIREDSFHATDLGTQLKPFIENWMTKEDIRRCPACGRIADAK
jgi:3-hydroxyanthranilate 3,4-dioxygenase